MAHPIPQITTNAEMLQKFIINVAGDMTCALTMAWEKHLDVFPQTCQAFNRVGVGGLSRQCLVVVVVLLF